MVNCPRVKRLLFAQSYSATGSKAAQCFGLNIVANSHLGLADMPSQGDFPAVKLLSVASLPARPALPLSSPSLRLRGFVSRLQTSPAHDFDGTLRSKDRLVGIKFAALPYSRMARQQIRFRRAGPLERSVASEVMGRTGLKSGHEAPETEGRR